MKKIEDAMSFRIFDYKTGETTDEIITCLKSPDGRILSLGNDMKRPEVTEHLTQHPEIEMSFPVEANKITDYESALALFKYFNNHYLFPTRRIHIKPNYGALIYHGYMSDEEKELFTKIMLDIGNKNALVLSADELLEGYSSLEEAIWALPDKYKKIRGAFEIRTH